MGKYFGTDGVRGFANETLTLDMAVSIGTYLGWYYGKNHRAKILIGKDTRLSGDMFEMGVAAGATAAGANVYLLGVCPTPTVSYLCERERFDCGVMISASHNPYEYNGIKFFNGEGFKLDDDLEEQIEDIIISSVDVNSHITGDKLGRCLEAEDNALELYAEFLKSTIDIRLDGMKIVLDCANGAAYKVAEKVYRDLGAEVVVIANTPDGININNACGSTHPEKLQEMVVKHNADLGLAYDGDADRLIAVDELGRIIDGDKTILMCAKMLKEEGKLTHNQVTATVMSNLGFHKACKEMGCNVEVTGVGDRYVLESMLENDYIIGGEQSGHIIFREFATTGDGELSALKLLCIMKESGKKLSELASEMKVFPQVLINVRVSDFGKARFPRDKEIKNAIESVEKELGDTGRVLVRVSGTEPLVRVMLEGKDEEKINVLAQEIAEVIRERLL